MKNILICPICAATLSSVETGFVCENQHHFDRARQGYLNLLLSQHKSSNEPGDDPAMVKSRADFLKQEHYAPVANALYEALSEVLECDSAVNIVDSGCGVGYYLAALKQRSNNNQAQYWGVDISKEAIKTACSFDRTIHWLVASAKRLPFMAQSVDVLISVFSPIYFEEVLRILKPNGLLIVVGPSDQHLIELRNIIYDEVLPIKTDKILDTIPEGFIVKNQIPIRFTLPLTTQAEIKNLLMMTPFYWKSSREKQQALLGLNALTVTVDMGLQKLSLY